LQFYVVYSNKMSGLHMNSQKVKNLFDSKSMEQSPRDVGHWAYYNIPCFPIPIEINRCIFSVLYINLCIFKCKDKKIPNWIATRIPWILFDLLIYVALGELR
jgi:hypothetical protein